jgi:putative nucleotidyltransferase with HDIG domain
MTTKILQLVNSAYFGLRVQVSDPEQAVALLGLDTIKALVLSMQTFSQFSDIPVLPYPLDALWRHGLAAAAHARAIAKAECIPHSMVDEAFTAALLHDVGILIFATSKPEEYAQVLSMMTQQGIPDWEAEQAVFGATHAEVGAYLLGMWGLPHAVVEAVAYHHKPELAAAAAFGPLTAVHVANAVVGDPDEGSAHQPIEARLNPDYLARGDWTGRLPHWQGLCRV